jgi:hypothetical protein
MIINEDFMMRAQNEKSVVDYYSQKSGKVNHLSQLFPLLPHTLGGGAQQPHSGAHWMQ